MKNTLFSALLALSAVGLLGACSDDSDRGDNSLRPIDIPAETRSYVDAANDFSFRLMQTLADESDDNFAVSPLSLTVSLSMFANAQTSLQAPTLEFLGFGSDDTALELTNRYCHDMLTQLPSADRSTVCKFGNSVWTDDKTLLTPGFTSTLRNDYLAEVFEKNPSGEKMRAEINKWISRNTKGLIHDFLKTPLSCDMALFNTAYFHGTWAKKFDPEKSRKEIFHNANGSVIRTDFMKQNNFATYYEDENMQMVALPYGNGNFEMVVILPDEETDINSVISDLDYKTFAEARANASDELDLLSMPKFSIDYSRDLKSVFNSMGLTTSGKKDAINLLHGVNITVDEAGTVAAAVSGVVITTGMHGRTEMICDRPFAYIIRETTTGAILFAGRVMKL